MGSIKAFSRLKLGMRSSVNGTSSTFAGRVGSARFLLGEACCTSAFSGLSDSRWCGSGSDLGPPICGAEGCDLGVELGNGIGSSVFFFTVAGFLSHAVMDDWSIVENVRMSTSACLGFVSLFRLVAGGLYGIEFRVSSLFTRLLHPEHQKASSCKKCRPKCSVGFAHCIVLTRDLTIPYKG